MMEFWNALIDAFGMLRYGEKYGLWFWPAVFLVTGLFCLSWFVRALVYRNKHGWDMAFFGGLALAVFLWSAGVFEASTGQYPGLAAIFSCARWAARVAIPCLLHLHIWKQVSHKVLTPLRLALNIAAPVAVLAVFFYTVLPLQSWNAPVQPGQYWMLLYYVYSVVFYLLCLAKCLSVFFQMPRHMRKSSYYMITGTLVMATGNLFSIWEGELAPYNLPLLITALAMHFLFVAQYANVAANVIATSRDFVFKSLSTTVLVLSEHHRILDWNRDWEDYTELLPEPEYKEHFEDYRRRIIAEGSGQVSPHLDSVIILKNGNLECQFLLKIGAISNGKKTFGHVVEISEITPVYRVLSLFEDIATVDHLTGLYNRNAYLADVQRYVEEAGAALCVVVGDINNLKLINDTMGHLIGDRLLTTVTGFIKDHRPQRARAYRIGGDEFVLLMPGAPAALAQAFIAAMDSSCNAMNDRDFGTPSVSWGYALWKNGSRHYNDAFSEADRMMYAQKKLQHHFTSSGMITRAQGPVQPGDEPPGAAIQSGIEPQTRRGDMMMVSNRPIKVVVCTPDVKMYTHAVMSLNKHMEGRCDLKLKYISIPSDMLKENPEKDFDVLLIDTAIEHPKCLELVSHFREMDPDFILMLMIDKPEDAQMGYPLKAFRCPRKDSLYDDMEACAADLLCELGIDRDTVEFQVANRRHRVYTDEILYAESQHHNVYIHYRGHNLEPSCISDSLTDIEHLLAPYGFYRIHQSYLINMAWLVSMNASWAVMANGQELPISHSNHHALRDEFQKVKQARKEQESSEDQGSNESLDGEAQSLQ